MNFQKKKNKKIKKKDHKNGSKMFLQRIFDWENYSYIKKKLTIINTPLRLLK